VELKRIISANEKITIGYDQFDQLCKVEQMQYKSGEKYTSSTMVWDIRGKACYICKRVWTDDPNEWEYEELERGRWEEKAGPDGKHKRLKDPVFVHPACYLGHLNINEKNLITGAINKARDAYKARVPYEIDAIPNQYKGAWDTEWYIIQLLESKPRSQIKFGSRKRVWVVELSSEEKLVVPEGHALEVLYKKEDVTKDGLFDYQGKRLESKSIMLHAWTKEKVREYVEAMIRLVEKPEKRE
jgi:hypothetical protein